MSCYITCLVGASLLGGSISSMLFKNDPRSKVLASRLNPQQMVVYNNILAERRNHYLQGNVLGFLLALVYFYNSGKFTKKTNVCAFVLIALSTTYFYYSLTPKSDYLLRHLTDSVQVEAFLAHYIHMKRQYHIGFLVAGLSYLLISYGMYSLN